MRGKSRRLVLQFLKIADDPGCVKTRMLIQFFRGFAGAWHEAVH